MTQETVTLDDIRAARSVTLDDIRAARTPKAAEGASFGDYLETGVHSISAGIVKAWAGIPDALAYAVRLIDNLADVHPDNKPVIDGKTIPEHLEEIGRKVRGSIDVPESVARSERMATEPNGILKSLVTTIPEGAGQLAGTLTTAGIGQAAGVAKATTSLPVLFGGQMAAGGYQDVKEWSGDEGKALLSGALNAAAGAVGGEILGGILGKLAPAGRKAVAEYAWSAAKGSATTAGLSLASDAIAKMLGDPRDREAVKKALEQGALGFMTPAFSGAFRGPGAPSPELAVPAWAQPSGGEAPSSLAGPSRTITLTGENPLSYEEQFRRQDAAAADKFVARATGAGDEAQPTGATPVDRAVKPKEKSERQRAIEYLDAHDPEMWMDPEFWRTAPDPMAPASDDPPTAAKVAEGAGVPPDVAANADPTRVTPVEEIADLRATQAHGLRQTLQWLADRWLARFNTNRDALVKERALTAIGGSRAEGRRLNRAIQFHIDRMEYGEEAWQRYLNIERTTTTDGRTLYPIVERDRATYVLSQNLPPAAQAIADRIIKENRALGQRAQEARLIDEYHDYYTRRIWRSDNTMPGAGRFALRPAATRARTLDSIAHGLSLGRELAVEGAIDAQRSARLQVHEAIMNRNFIELGLRSGFFSGEETHGWKTIDHPAFVKHSISAPPELANKLNSVLSVSVLRDWAPLQIIDRIAATYRTSVMSLGYVHHANGIRAALLSGEVQSLSDLNPAERFRQGLDLILEGGHHLQAGVRNGLQLGIAPEFDELHQMDRSAFTKKLVEAAQRFPQVERARRAITELSDRRHHFLFNEFFPALQAFDFELSARRAFAANEKALRDGSMSPDDLYRAVAKTVNDRYGIVNREQTGRGGKAAGTLRHIANWGLFAPSWTETRFRLIAKMLVGPDGEKAAYREMMGRTVGRLAVVHLAWDLAMASIQDDTDKGGKDFRERFMKQITTEPWEQLTGVRATPLVKALGDVSGDESFLGLSSVLMRGLGMIHEPGKEFGRVGSVFMHAVTEAASGEDALGRPFTDIAEITGTDDPGFYKETGQGHIQFQSKGGQMEGELASHRASGRGGITLSQVPSWAGSQAIDFVPPPVQGVVHLLRGQMRGMQLMLNTIGLNLRRSKPTK